MSGAPTKSEITQIFKRLQSATANKLCFDCHSKNPTWSSVTYGIFICIDCSGIHRSLGVHLTFVRSTQLDSNWTWQQLRQMQLGGNSNATTFFRQHHVNTSDTQVKYKSRAAQLYRDKLHHAASQALRLHGTKLFIDTPHNEPKEDEENDGEVPDFFEHHEKENGSGSDAAPSLPPGADLSSARAPKSLPPRDDDGVVPNVEAALSTSPSEAMKQHADRKPTIGQRKANAKKPGLGGKKGGGLGAQKVKKDFSEIEREAEMADQLKDRMDEERRVNDARRTEDDAKALANMKLAYQDLSLESKKREEKLRNVDSRKAEQVERLGMGAVSSKGGVSHSALNQMNTIVQEEPSSGRRNFGGPKKKDFDDFEIISNEWRRGQGGSKSYGCVQDDEEEEEEFFDGFGGGGGGRKSNWEREFEVMKSTTASSKPSAATTGWSNDFDEDRSSRSRGAERSSATSHSGDDAQKKFGGAKAISSDMYFGDQDNSAPDANLSRFQGSSSISSSEYFGRDDPRSQRYGSGMSAPDMDDVKESVRQGVSKVAGKLSNMASGVMTQLQDKYGY